MHKFRTPAICQPSFDLAAQLQSDSCTLKCPLGSLSALAAAGQLSCSLSARLPGSLSALTTFSPAANLSLSAIRWLGCGLSTLLHIVTSFVAHVAHMSVHLESVSSAVLCQSCILSALACFVKRFICCDRPQFSYELQAPLQSVISAAIRYLSCNLLAQSVSCNLSTPLSGSAATCQLSCTLSSQLQHVG